MPVMKIGVSLPEDIVAFADEAARGEGTSRSELLARLLETERIRQPTVVAAPGVFRYFLARRVR